MQINNSQLSLSTKESLVETLNQDHLRSGKVLRIELKNFMCHSNLAIDFNKRSNLLVGKNGSGKSAILAALIIGLGSKSSATSRCQNLKRKFLILIHIPGLNTLFKCYINIFL